MSAWIVSKRHIDYMVTAIVRAELMNETPDEIGRILWRENLASVAYRYPNDKDGERPGPEGFRDMDTEIYTWTETPELTPGGVAKTFACYDYQSCEHPGWDGSEAEVVTTKLIEAIGNIEWPTEVPWGWD
jgi:hypothetical protein